MRPTARPHYTPLTRAQCTGASIARHSRIREQVTKETFAAALMGVACHWLHTVLPHVSTPVGAAFVAVPFGILVAAAAAVYLKR